MWGAHGCKGFKQEVVTGVENGCDGWPVQVEDEVRAEDVVDLWEELWDRERRNQGICRPGEHQDLPHTSLSKGLPENERNAGNVDRDVHFVRVIRAVERELRSSRSIQISIVTKRTLTCFSTLNRSPMVVVVQKAG